MSDGSESESSSEESPKKIPMGKGLNFTKVKKEETDEEYLKQTTGRNLLLEVQLEVHLPDKSTSNVAFAIADSVANLKKILNTKHGIEEDKITLFIQDGDKKVKLVDPMSLNDYPQAEAHASAKKPLKIVAEKH
jgi:hypothetical protein